MAPGERLVKMLKDAGEKIPASDRSDVESGISALREALKGEDGQAMASAFEDAFHETMAVAFAQFTADVGKGEP